MIEGSINYSDLVRHKGSGEMYRVSRQALMKQGDGEWELCIIYTSEQTAAFYVRDERTFREKFERVRR